MTHYLVADLTFVCTDPSQNTDEGFDAFTDAVLDALYDLAEVDDGIIDPDATVVITDRRMCVVMGIVADTLDDARRLFSANLRTALHAAGCVTRDWPVYEPTVKAPEVREADFATA